MPFTKQRLVCAVIFAATILYGLNQGPMIFEHFTSDATWASNPPDSFHMFLGPHGHETRHYWELVSPVTLAALALALVLGWRSSSRAWLVLGLLCCVVVQVATIWYFVPAQAGVIADASRAPASELAARAESWLAWNRVRMAVAILGSVFLLRAVQTTHQACRRLSPS
jgi:hypothetical protein